MYSVNFALILITIFIVLLVFSFFIEDSNLRLCYWLVVMLLALTIFNIILSWTYYTRLRNEPGIPGPRGPPGEKGSKGVKGVCSISEKCRIEGCKDKIVDIAGNVFPQVSKMCIKSGKCRSKEKSLGRAIHDTVRKLAIRCEKTKMAEPDFMKKIRPSLARLEEDGDIKN